VRAQAAIARVGAKASNGRGATEYKLSRAVAATAPAGPAPAGLRAWRAHVAVDEVAGRALVDDATGALVNVELAAKFTTKRDGRDLHGAADVRVAVTDVGATPTIVAPPAETLAGRQRLVPEQRELLAGLPSTRGLPPGPPRLKAPAAATAPAPAKAMAPTPAKAPIAPKPTMPTPTSGKVGR
jgi:hypothetical protein